MEVFSDSRSGRFIPGKRAVRTRFIKVWVGLRAIVGVLEKNTFFPMPGIEPRLLVLPTRSLVTIPIGLSWLTREKVGCNGLS
jgi:hypothetical protein